MVSVLLFSCKKDDEETLNGDPNNWVDKDHVTLTNEYGIVATFPKDQWTNTYIDTMPADKNSYFDGFRYNAICASLLSDTIIKEGDTLPRYMTSIYFMRFHETFDNQEACDEFIQAYKERIYDDYATKYHVYYEKISEISDTIIGKKSYKAKHFTARRGGSGISEGVEKIYLIYEKPRLYGVNIKIDDNFAEASLQKCTDILQTVSIQ